MDDNPEIQYLQGRNVTLVGTGANLCLIVLKLWGGVVSRSQALVADGLHSLSDLLSDFVVLLGLKWGRVEEDADHQFGHGRIETLASFLVGIILAAAGIGMGWAAVSDIRLGKVHDPTGLAIVVAFVSVLSKEFLYHYTRIVGKRISSPALMSNAWHHRSDALSSVAVIVGVAGAMLIPGWGVLDSWAALVVSALVIKVGASFVWSATQEFIDTAPHADVLAEIVGCAASVQGVEDVHDLRARTSGGKVFVQLHIVVDGEIPVRKGHDIAKEVETCLIERVPHLSTAIVHVDPADEGTSK